MSAVLAAGEARDRLENALCDARIYGLLLRAVIDSTGLERKRDGQLVVSDDDAELISFVSLKLEHHTREAWKAFEEALR